MNPSQLPDDVETLKVLLRQALERNEQLQEQIRVLLAKRFGPSSEKRAPEQMGLFNEAEADADAQPFEAPADETITVPGHERAKPGRRPLPGRRWGQVSHGGIGLLAMVFTHIPSNLFLILAAMVAPNLPYHRVV